MENIIQDIGSLGLQFDKITYTSDYFPQVPAGAAVSTIFPECSIPKFPRASFSAVEALSPELAILA